MTGPRVSIITCSYNHAKYVEDCIRSVLSQTIQDWEWLIFDDGSTDGTADFFQNLCDPRVRFQKGSHKGADGVLERKNELLQKTAGEWVAFMDSDDVWMASRLETQMKAAHSSDAVLVHSPIFLIDAEGNKRRRLAPSADDSVLTNTPIGAAATEALALLNFPVFSTAALVRRSALMGVGGFQAGNALWDFSTFLELSLHGKFHYVMEPLSCWRRHSGQTSLRPDRLAWQYRAHMTRASEFFMSHSSQLPVGLSYVQIKQRQMRTLMRADEAGMLMRADSLLDVDAWFEARTLYLQYLAMQARSGERRFKYTVAAGLGLVSTLMHINLIRMAFDIKKRMEMVSDQFLRCFSRRGNI